MLGAFVPAIASAQTYPYYDYNASNYNYNYGCGYGYYPYANCTPAGTLLVYVQINNQYQNGYYLSPSDVTVFVSGAPVGQQYFAGSSSGTALHFTGSYTVSVFNLTGAYTASYGANCSGTLSTGQTQACYITLNSTYAYPYNTYPYNNYPYNYYPYNYTQYQQPVTVVSKYVTSLPNTGYAPVSSSAIAFMLALILTAAVATYPYVRKAAAALLG
jgi:hypothetical protein